VGAAKGRFLADGDVIATTIDGVGTMTNRVVRISDPIPLGG
jgi:2-keto-4-pentenoate hydratase/2-oxohepta-3-ene-1,7-dioic acid hydratase in catechol pathway